MGEVICGLMYSRAQYAAMGVAVAVFGEQLRRELSDYSITL